MRLFVVSRLVALLGFLLTACRALLAVAMATNFKFSSHRRGTLRS